LPAPAFTWLAGFDPAAGTSLATIDLAIDIPFANPIVFNGLVGYSTASSLDSGKQPAHLSRKT
jgi:hypothetical protein